MMNTTTNNNNRVRDYIQQQQQNQNSSVPSSLKRLQEQLQQHRSWNPNTTTTNPIYNNKSGSDFVTNCIGPNFGQTGFDFNILAIARKVFETKIKPYFTAIDLSIQRSGPWTALDFALASGEVCLLEFIEQANKDLARRAELIQKHDEWLMATNLGNNNNVSADAAGNQNVIISTSPFTHEEDLFFNVYSRSGPASPRYRHLVDAYNNDSSPTKTNFKYNPNTTINKKHLENAKEGMIVLLQLFGPALAVGINELDCLAHQVEMFEGVAAAKRRNNPNNNTSYYTNTSSFSSSSSVPFHRLSPLTILYNPNSSLACYCVKDYVISGNGRFCPCAYFQHALIGDHHHPHHPHTAPNAAANQQQQQLHNANIQKGVILCKHLLALNLAFGFGIPLLPAPPPYFARIRSGGDEFVDDFNTKNRVGAGVAGSPSSLYNNNSNNRVSTSTTLNLHHSNTATTTTATATTREQDDARKKKMSETNERFAKSYIRVLQNKQRLAITKGNELIHRLIEEHRDKWEVARSRMFPAATNNNNNNPAANTAIDPSILLLNKTKNNPFSSVNDVSLVTDIRVAADFIMAVMGRTYFGRLHSYLQYQQQQHERLGTISESVASVRTDDNHNNYNYQQQQQQQQNRNKKFKKIIIKKKVRRPRVSNQNNQNNQNQQQQQQHPQEYFTKRIDRDNQPLGFDDEEEDDENTFRNNTHLEEEYEEVETDEEVEVSDNDDENNNNDADDIPPEAFRQNIMNNNINIRDHSENTNNDSRSFSSSSGELVQLNQLNNPELNRQLERKKMMTMMMMAHQTDDVDGSEQQPRNQQDTALPNENDHDENDEDEELARCRRLDEQQQRKAAYWMEMCTFNEDDLDQFKDFIFTNTPIKIRETLFDYYFLRDSIDHTATHHQQNNQNNNNQNNNNNRNFSSSSSSLSVLIHHHPDPMFHYTMRGGTVQVNNSMSTAVADGFSSLVTVNQSSLQNFSGGTASSNNNVFSSTKRRNLGLHCLPTLKEIFERNCVLFFNGSVAWLAATDDEITELMMKSMEDRMTWKFDHHHYHSSSSGHHQYNNNYNHNNNNNNRFALYGGGQGQRQNNNNNNNMMMMNQQ